MPGPLPSLSEQDWEQNFWTDLQMKKRITAKYAQHANCQSTPEHTDANAEEEDGKIMTQIRKNKVAAEMARRKVRFHPDEKWNEINLWGLFDWGEVKHLLDSGDLTTHMKKENVTIWVLPSEVFWNDHIKPLIDKHTIDELTKLAGW